jgi:hypothetical protein
MSCISVFWKGIDEQFSLWNRALSVPYSKVIVAVIFHHVPFHFRFPQVENMENHDASVCIRDTAVIFVFRLRYPGFHFFPPVEPQTEKKIITM